MRRHGWIIGICALTLALAAEAGAQPTETGESGLIAMPTTETLAPGTFSLGGTYRRDLESNTAFEPSVGGLRDTDLSVGEFSMGVGLTENFELSIQLPWVDYQIDRPGEQIQARDVAGFRITPKLRLLNESAGDPMSLAIQGSAIFPGGSSDLPAPLDRSTLFRDEFSGELMASIDKVLFTLPREAPVVLTLNAGALILGGDDDVQIGNLTQPVFAQLRRKGVTTTELASVVPQFGAGLELPLLKDEMGQLDQTIEFRANTGTIDDADAYRALLVGLRYFVWNGLAIHGGIDFGLSNSVDRYNVVAGLSFTGPSTPPVRVRESEKVIEKIVYRDRVIEVEKVLVPNVYFEFDKATLTNVGKAEVYRIAQRIRGGESLRLELRGHADHLGTDEYNKKLALRRAETVKAEFVRLGIAAEQIATLSFGESDPMIDRDEAWARAGNRRVELSIVNEGDPEAR